jgi:hypothetical protein
MSNRKYSKSDIKKLNKELESVPKVAASEVLKDPDHVVRIFVFFI